MKWLYRITGKGLEVTNSLCLPRTDSFSRTWDSSVVKSRQSQANCDSWWPAGGATDKAVQTKFPCASTTFSSLPVVHLGPYDLCSYQWDYEYKWWVAPGLRPLKAGMHSSRPSLSPPHPWKWIILGWKSWLREAAEIPKSPLEKTYQGELLSSQ